MSELKRLAEALDQYLRPQTFPVAIRMVAEGEPLPARARRPSQDMGFQVAICQAVAMARRYGWVVAVGRDDLSCPIAKAVFGFAPMLGYYEQGHACAGMYTETPEGGAVSESLVARFDEGAYKFLLAAPMHRCAFEPHVVMLYGSPAQVMRLVTAALWKRGGRIESGFSGRVDCSDGVIHTMQTGRPQVILPCYGDRIFAQSEEHEMAFSIPAGRFDDIVEGFEGTHRGGVRYPIPSFLRYQGEFPPTYEKMNELWAEGDND